MVRRFTGWVLAPSVRWPRAVAVVIATGVIGWLSASSAFADSSVPVPSGRLHADVAAKLRADVAAIRAGNVHWFATPRPVTLVRATGVGSTPAAIPPTASASPLLAYTIRNANSNLCLDVYQGHSANGTNVDQWTCNGNSNQYWTRYFVGYVGGNGAPIDIIVPNNSASSCLDVYGRSLSAGANVDIWTCNSGLNQDWVDVYSSGYDFYYDYNTLVNNPSHIMALDVQNASKASGANVWQWSVTYGTSQFWYS